MDTIIDFLLSNIFVLLIIAGFISSIIKRAKKAVNDQNRKPVRLPKESSKPLPEPKGMASSKPEPVNAALNYTAIKTEFPAETKGETLEEWIAGASLPPENTHPEEESSSFQGSTINLDNKSIIEGIILAEVLGPPRAKRPVFVRR
ncbi:hypothetical protein CVD28_22930 [Bacillus sp. M6-12]|uniref:hypothetical protein n=1 Tax=Bacillus sp. M6-12 TaxID=2054166 RepID=UPI000C7564BA|nr:hypothetical protein [Bacillus sp. M6-12]PLS15188.1 hypothetical protein CVD28_22930 [Bacillus sp. M6-12]